MKKTNYTEEHTHHHYYGWDKILIGLFIICFSMLIITAAINKIHENKIVHYNCVNACSEKHFMGMEIGRDRLNFREHVYPVMILLS